MSLFSSLYGYGCLRKSRSRIFRQRDIVDPYWAIVDWNPAHTVKAERVFFHRELEKIMRKLEMRSFNVVKSNIVRLAELFPNCVKESWDETGQVRRLIDFDGVRQELSEDIFEGGG